MHRSKTGRWAGVNQFVGGVALATLAALTGACSDGSDIVIGPDPPGHAHIEVGTSEPGAGTITMKLPGDTVEVFESAEVGSFTLWSSTAPAIFSLEEDEPDEGLYAFPEGVPLSLELTALDAGVRVQYGETILEEPGDSVLIDNTPFHTHWEWQLVLPQGTHDGEYGLSFRITTTTPPFLDSEVATVALTPTEGSGHHEEGE
jgi:hypothetical protein